MVSWKMAVKRLTIGFKAILKEVQVEAAASEKAEERRLAMSRLVKEGRL